MKLPAADGAVGKVWPIRRVLPRIVILGVGMLVTFGPTEAARAQAGAPNGAPNTVERARALARDGDHATALELLAQRLASAPEDDDARVLLGIVLSWDGRYDDARTALEMVLSRNRFHSDAIRAAINLELWSGHPARAEELTRDGLSREPIAIDLLLGRARALDALGRPAEVALVTDEILRLEPTHELALHLRRKSQADRQPWEVAVGYTYEGFSDKRRIWNEGLVHLKRRLPYLGALVARAYYAKLDTRRPSVVDGSDPYDHSTAQQFELAAYPTLRHGTYADIGLAYSPQSTLYPRYRTAIDLYQNLGAGFEGSAGFRRLGFDNAVNVLVFTLSKELADWLVTARGFVTPGDRSESLSLHLAVRHFFWDRRAYAAARYGYGSFRDETTHSALDILLTNAHTVGGEIEGLLFGRWELIARGAFTYQTQGSVSGPSYPLEQYSLSAASGFRF